LSSFCLLIYDRKLVNVHGLLAGVVKLALGRHNMVMRIVADLHIHSRYSRAVSREMTPENLDIWADDKGIAVMGTGDFTHPLWIKELEEKLEPAEPGLFRIKKEFQKRTIKGTVPETRFMLTVEIAGIYSRGGKTRRVHNLIFAPSFAAARKINKDLGRVGNLKADGRPILGLDSEHLIKIVLEADDGSVVVPAHAWTPWFSVFGSMSGFNSLEECFGDYSKHIFAIETGLSSDPLMNRRVRMLDNIALISNSDSHSLERIGREANLFECELSYDGIIEAIKSGIPHLNLPPQGGEEGVRPKFLETIEFFPEEGKYHFDGHRLCGVVWEPAETKKHKGICTGCGAPVTVGVLSRVEELADRAPAEAKKIMVPYKNLVTLDTIIGEALDVGPKSKSVKKQYDKLIREFGSELRVLTEAQIPKIAATASAEVAEGVARMREGKLNIRPGYDGEYGQVRIFGAGEREKINPPAGGQNSLF
jgi:uncharacterized protein (TIGR00375 family)